MDPVLTMFWLVAFIASAASFFHGVLTIINTVFVFMEDDTGLWPKILAFLEVGLSLIIMSLAFVFFLNA